MSDSRIVADEAEFHDRWAEEIDVDQIDLETCFHGSTSPENRFIIEQLGSVRGLRVLELGAGAGENSVYFALQGAEVTATDISPGMLEVVQRLAARHGVRVETRVANAMALEFPDGSFDVVYAANTFHHVDPAVALREVHRVLKPGGRLCSWDPLTHNPVINIYRRMATKVRSRDEMPLSIHFVDDVRRLFSEVRYDTFWFFTLWIFMQFYLIERVHPNKERYWKKILFEEKRLRSLYLRLEKLDRLVKKVPYFRRFAWNLAIVATK